MGPSQTAQQNQKSQKKDEAVILFQAGKVVKQLNLYSSQRQLKEQQHLVARIMIYGHSHLIQHLKNLPRPQKFNFIRYLRRIDIETMDLLYQSYIQQRLKSNKKHETYIYSKIEYLDKKQQSENHQKQANGYHMLTRLGEILLQKKKIAILIFIGGNSSRFMYQVHNTSVISKHKQFYKEHEDQKSLIEIKLDQINELCAKYGEQHVYIVHNEVNHKELNKLLARYKEFKPKKVLQSENLIVTLSGKFCLKDQQDYELIQSPSGCGDFINCTVTNKKIIEDMTQEGVQYICCLGAENILENLADPYILGLIHSRSNLGVVYKCTYPENQNEQGKRIVYNKSKKQIEVKDLDILLQQCNNNSIEIIKRSPIWTNSLMIRIQSLKKAIEDRMNSLSEIKKIQQVYTVKKIKATYYNPNEKVYQQNQYCYTFQRELSDLLMGSGITMEGVMVPRQDQYMPVISICNQMIWREAYREYTQKQENKKIKGNRQEDNIKIISLGMGRTKKIKENSYIINLQSKLDQQELIQNTNETNDVAIKEKQYQDSIISVAKSEKEV